MMLHSSVLSDTLIISVSQLTKRSRRGKHLCRENCREFCNRCLGFDTWASPTARTDYDDVERSRFAGHIIVGIHRECNSREVIDM